MWQREQDPHDFFGEPRMKSPWTKKNPFLSMWLSGANAIAGAARGRMSAEAKRQTRTAINKGIQQATDFWLGGASSAKTSKKRKRR
jgi:hypothetical protein